MNIEKSKSLILNLINDNNSKDGDNNVKGYKKNYDFKTFRFFNPSEEGVIIINVF